MSGALRLADLIGSLSVVADLGFGLPAENSIRSSLIATGLARRLGLDSDDQQAALYVSLLMHIGCISMSHETAEIFGNEIAVTRAVAMTNLGDPHDITENLIPEIGRLLGPKATEEKMELVLAQTETFGKQYDTASAEVARRTARRIGLTDSVQRGLYESAEAWNGEGAPRGLAGDDISIAARLARLAGDAAFFHHLGGPPLASEAVSARAGTIHDPDIARLFVHHCDELLGDLDNGEPAQRLLDAEPWPALEIDPTRLLDVASAIGDAADMKSPYTHGHSGTTAQVAADAAQRAGLGDGVVEDLRIAALLHEIGRVAISDVLWEKAGPLTRTEWEQVHLHPYHAERILVRTRHLQAIARIAGMHHERLDGSGYHRGSRAAEIPMAARILAAASAWVAMHQPRAHRPALEADRAATELKAESRDGRLDPQAAEAVLEVAGLASSAAPELPAGLSRRELEVLRLVAAGCSNPEIAGRLHISRRTAEHHVQHIYTKIGVSTRPGAALFALENDLLEPIGS